MKCVCITRCLRFDPRIERDRYFAKGDMGEFDECPIHFKELGEDFDLLTSSKAELLETKWSFDDAKKAYKEKYNITLRKLKDKEKIVNQMLDARFRAV